MNKFFLLLAVSIFVSGCAETGKSFTKTGVSQSQVDKDRYQCMQASKSSDMYGGTYINGQLYNACMKANGYTAVK